jgi:hypothetical protein
MLKKNPLSIFTQPVFKKRSRFLADHNIRLGNVNMHFHFESVGFANGKSLYKVDIYNGMPVGPEKNAAVKFFFNFRKRFIKWIFF